MQKNKKVVVLGIDAGAKDLLLRWGRDGTLPTFQRLLSKSLIGNTTSTPGLFVGSTWESFFTGVNPGKHGRYSQRELKSGTYEFVANPLGTKCEPFWNHLGREGCEVAILDVPHSSISPHLPGIQMVEYGAHDAHFGFHTWPPELAKEVEKQFGPPSFHPVRGDCDAKRDADGVVVFRDNLIKSIAKKTKLTKHFLQQGQWDLFVQVFTESHCIGHQCWHIHDYSHQWHEPEVAKLVGDPIQDVYQALDTGLGEILQEIDDDTTVIIFVSHGMGQTNVPYGFLEKLLLHLKVATPPPSKTHYTLRFLVRKRLFPFLSRIWHKTPSNLQHYLGRLKAAISKGLHTVPSPINVDREAGQCFSIHDNPSHSGIRVNLVGREPHGKIHPGAEYQKFCADLEKDLLGIKNVATGKPVVKRIIRTAEHYSGPYLAHFPDILVEWDEDEAIHSVFSEKFGEINTRFWYPRTGHHRPEGMFLACGPQVEPGFLKRTLSVMDFAPTIAQILNVSLPDYEGDPIHELLQSPLQSVNPSDVFSSASQKR